MSNKLSFKETIAYFIVFPLVVLVWFLFGSKMTGTITWSWWWVFSPLWAPIATVLIFLAIFSLAGWIKWNKRG